MSDKPWKEERVRESDSSRDGPMTRTHSHIRPGIAVSVQINNSLCFYFTSQPGQAVFTSPSPLPCLHWLFLLLLWAHTHTQGRGAHKYLRLKAVSAQSQNTHVPHAHQEVSDSESPSQSQSRSHNRSHGPNPSSKFEGVPLSPFSATVVTIAGRTWRRYGNRISNRNRNWNSNWNCNWQFTCICATTHSIHSFIHSIAGQMNAQTDGTVFVSNTKQLSRPPFPKKPRSFVVIVRIPCGKSTNIACNVMLCLL